MALSKEDIQAAYPLPAYNYRVTILAGSSPNSGAASVISCSEVSGLNMEIETVSYKHGFSFLSGTHIIPGQKKEVQLTIRKGVTRNSSYFSEWIKMVYPMTGGAFSSQGRKRNLLIDLCDETGEAVVRWTVIKALPIKLEAPTFDANTNEVAFERMDFIAHQLKIDHLAAS